MVDYIIAIPTYNRVEEVIKKTLNTLKNANINKSKIYLFVANKQQFNLYNNNVPKDMYNKIIIGKKGITNQRMFISKYFPEGQYIISMDDDIEDFKILKGENLIKLKNINKFFIEAYKLLLKEKLYIWGIYPVYNPFFMYNEITTDLRFIIGMTYGYINRHNKNLKLSGKTETKEDYELTILYYKLDGGVLRFNNICVKSKLNAPGGLGTDRFERNEKSANYLKDKYPDIVIRKDRKNGMPEIKLKRLPRITNNN